jgi:hypothetical protein
MTTADGTILGTTRIVDNGPPSERWDLVIMGDGYQAHQLAQYGADVQQFVDIIFRTRPFDRLRPAINVHRVDVASTDSGADDPTACGGSGMMARTYFDATFCNNGVRRLLVANATTALNTANAQMPQWNVALVLVNSTVYGGSGGAVATLSLAPRAEEIGLHEIGHTAFGLADEYEYYQGCGVDIDRNNHPVGEPAEVNVTVDNNRATLKWRHLVASSTPVPTTSNADCTQCDRQASPVLPGTTGLFEGAHYYHCGAYRPEFSCKMRILGNPFCAVCCERIRTALAPYLPVPGPFPLVRQGDEGERVRTIQFLLGERGFPVTVDGVFGPDTEQAVRSFQASRSSLAVDGIVGPNTWGELFINRQRGDSGSAVQAIQSQLASWCVPLTIDGIFDPTTESAVNAFQALRSLTVDGIVGPNTWRALVQ